MLEEINIKFGKTFNNSNIHRWLWWKYRDFRNFIRYGTADFFTDFNIEINTSCNRQCDFCPNSKYDRGLLKNEKLMDEKVFKKIIDELAEYNFDGRIGPHFYGEPLLDKRLVEFVKYMREKLPDIRININTNGDFLTIARYNELVDAGATRFMIGYYDEKPTKAVTRLLNYVGNHPERKVKVSHKKFDRDAPHSTRGGEVVAKVVEPPRCLSPLNPVVIDYKGDVVLCCNDYHSSVVFGNVEKNTILEIWNTEKFGRVRKELRKGIYRLPICKICAGETNQKTGGDK